MKPVVIGLGSPLRRDDSVGLEIAGYLKRSNCLPSAEIILSRAGLLPYLSSLAGRPAVVVVDAVDVKLPPGGVIRRVWTGRTPTQFPGSEVDSHSANLALAFAVLAQQGLEMERFVLYGVQPRYLDFGEDLSPEVLEAREFLVSLLMSDFPWNRKDLRSESWVYSKQDDKWRRY